LARFKQLLPTFPPSPTTITCIFQLPPSKTSCSYFSHFTLHHYHYHHHNHNTRPTDRPTAPNSSLAIPYRRPSYRFLRIFESGELPFAVSIPFALPQRCIVFEAIERYTSCPDGYEAIVWRGARDTAKSGVRRLACCWVLLLLLLLLLLIDALCLSPIHCR
jgi:hypothetical protein